MRRRQRLLGTLTAALTVVGPVLLGTATPVQAQAVGSFHLRQLESARCADVRAEDNDQAPGARIQLKPCSAATGLHLNFNQIWEPILVADFTNTYILESVVSEMCMDLAQGTVASGTQVIQEPCDANRGTQRFVINSTFPTGLSPAVLQVATNLGECLDSQDPFVKIFPCVNPPSVAQAWRFESFP